MARLQYQSVNLFGTDLDMTPADVVGEIVPAHPHGFLVVKNAAATFPLSVSVQPPGLTQFGVPQPAATTVVPAGETRYIGPLVQELFDQGAKGVRVFYSVTPVEPLTDPQPDLPTVIASVTRAALSA